MQRSGLNVQRNGVQANGNEIYTSTQRIYGDDLKSTWWNDVGHIINKENDVINDRHSGSKRALLDIVGDDSMTIRTHQQTNQQSSYGVSQDTVQSEWNQTCELNSETLCSEPIVRRQNKKQRTEHQLNLKQFTKISSSNWNTNSQNVAQCI
jgi:hypothetical protein